MAIITLDGLSAFGLQAKDAGKFADVLAKASTSTNTSVSMLGESFKYSASAAHAAGMEIEQTAAFLGMLADNGIKGSAGGTVLNAVLRDMKKSAEDGAISIGKTKVAIYDAKGNMRDFSDIIGDVEKSTQGMTQAQKDAALMAVFGDEAMRGINISMAEGSEKLKGLEKAFYGAEGAAEEMSKRMQDNLQGDLTNLSSAMEGAAIAIGEKLEPALRKIVQAITGVVSWFNKLDDKTQTIIAIVAALSATFLLLLGPILIIVSMLPSFLAGLSLLGITFSSTIGIIAAVVAVLGTLAAAMYIYWDPVSEFFTKLWADIVTAFETAKEKITEAMTGLSSVSSVLKSAFDSAFSGIANLVNSALGGITNAFKSVYDAINSLNIVGLLGGVSGALATLAGAALTLLGPWGMVAKVFLMLATQTTFFTDVLAMLRGEMDFTEVASNLVQSFQNIIEKFVEMASEMIPIGVKFITNFIEGQSSARDGLMQSSAELIKTLIQGIMTALPLILKSAGEIVKILAQGIQTALPMVIQVMVTVIQTLVETVVTLLPVIIELAITLITTLVEGIVTALPMLIEGAILLITTLVESIVSLLPMLIEVAITILTTLLDGIIAALPMIIEAALQIVTTLVKSISMLVPMLIVVALLLVVTLVNAIITLLPMIIEAAIQLVMSLLDGIISALPVLLDAAIQIVTALITGLIEMIPALLEAAVLLVVSLVTAIIGLIPTLIDAGIQLITALIEGILSLIPVIIESGIKLIVELVKAILTLIPVILKAGVDLIMALIKGILSLLGALLSAGVQLITSLISTILGFLGKLMSVGKELLASLISGIASMIGSLLSTGAQLLNAFLTEILGFLGKLLTAGVDLVKSMIDGVVSMTGNMINVGKDLVQGLIDGIMGMAGDAIDAITGVVGGVVDKAKNLLGIKSPSRVFMQIGSDTVEGMEIGMKKRSESLNRTMEDITGKLIKVTEAYKKEEREVNAKHHKDIQSIERKAGEDIAKIQRGATAKKRRLTEDELVKIRRIKEIADKKTTEIEKKMRENSIKSLEKFEKEKFDIVKMYVDDKKSLNELSLIEEAKIWEESIKQFADGTKEKLKAQQEYKKAVEALEKEIYDINKKYSDEMQKLDKETADAIKKSTEEYEKAWGDRFKTVHDFGGLFSDFVVDYGKNSYDLINNLENQVEALLEWDKTLKSLEGKIDDERMLEELTALGPESLGNLQAINDMTERELEQFVSLYQQKYQLAKNIVNDEMREMKYEHYDRVDELKEQANKQAEELTQEWALNMQELVGVTDNRLKPLKQVGVDAGQGLYDGLKSMEGPLMSLAQSIADGIRQTIQSALDIHSPSRVMRGIGENIGEGLYLGMDSTIRDIEKSAVRMAGAATDGNYGTTGSGTSGITQNITVVSPEPTDAYENARAFKRAQQQMALDW